MKITLRRTVPFLALATIILSSPAVYAETTTTHPEVKTTTTTTTTDSSTKDADRLATVKSRGDAEISRRLTSLNTLVAKINSTVKLSAADKATLTNEVTAEISSLTALKAKLDAETSLSAAFLDAKSIVADYRIYALVVPQIALLRTADEQQTVEAKLTAVATKLQTRIQEAQTAGKNVSSLQTLLSDMQSKVQAAQTVTSGVITKIASLKPADYNSDHKILSGYRDQLKTAHSDNEAALTDAKSILTGLKSLK